MKCKHWISADFIKQTEHYCKRMPLVATYSYITGRRTNREYGRCKEINTEGKCELYEENIDAK
jgi:hypothetical protein